MGVYRRFNLQTENGIYMRLNEDYIKPFADDLLNILDGQDYMNTLEFARTMMISQELKANNVIEGIKDDLSIIDEVIEQKDNLSETERKRIINLYHGYQYILTHEQINKESLRELYKQLSDGLLDEYAVKNMGEYYRTKPVYILKGNRIDVEPYEGFKADKIDYNMNQLFDFIHSDDLEKSDIEKFIKSQVMHFYFVYIHPFFDVNGRTSRTTSMWYLLNNQEYPYIIFNRAISFNQRDYEANIVKARAYGDVTLFIKYMLQVVQMEIEKEYVIHSMKKNIDYELTKEDDQLLEYILTMKGNITIKDIRYFYNNFNDKKNAKYILDKVQPLIDNHILINKGQTKSFVTEGVPNVRLSVNNELIDVDRSKIKYLKLDNYI